MLKCEQLYEETHCHGGALHRKSAFHVFCSEWSYAIFWCFAIHIWCYCGPFSHEFHHQHSFPVPEISFHQISVRQGMFKLFGTFAEFVCIHCFECSLDSTFTNATQLSSPITKLLRYSWPTLWYRCKNPNLFPSLCAHPWAFPEPILRKTCDSVD
jgi:hypothetical protein